MFAQKAASTAIIALTRGTLVSCAGILQGVQSPTGDVVPCERLGPGVIEDSSPDGRVLVKWTGLDFASWLEPVDLQPFGADARLITVNRLDEHGNSKRLRNKVLGTAGLRYNWTVEVRPKGIIRVVRADGHAWTFNKNPVFKRLMTPGWNGPPDDEDAEALTAAEMAL